MCGTVKASLLHGSELDGKRRTFMYAYSYDNVAGTMVGVLARPFNEEVDNQRILESIAKQQEDALNPAGGGLFILVVDPRFPHPNATWRRRFAEARESVRFARSLFAVVTSEVSLRGVLTAVNWLSPPTPHFEAEAFTSFDDAVKWMQGKRGRQFKMLQQLLDEVHEKLGYPLSGPSPSQRAAR